MTTPLEGGPQTGPSPARRIAVALLGAALLGTALALGPRAVDTLSDRGLFSVRPAAPAEAPVPALAGQTVVGAATGSTPVAWVFVFWGARLVLLAAAAALGARLLVIAALGGPVPGRDRRRRRRPHGPPAPPA